jgi:DNA-binding response OmpR family regulator
VQINHKILIIEDDFDISEMLETFFIQQGYAVTSSHWGEDGIRSATEKRPDLIILDIRLPDIDGYEVARRLKSERATSDIPIIYLTERRDRADRLKGLELGADDYITKPFDMAELKLRVKNVISRYQPQVLTNALTGLPDGKLVIERIEAGRRVENTFVVFNIQNLPAFRQLCGDDFADDVVKNSSTLIRNALRDANILEGFLGHITPTGFVIIFRSTEAEQFYSRLVHRLEMAMDFFYPPSIDRADIVPETKLSLTHSFTFSKDLTQYDLDELVNYFISL